MISALNDSVPLDNEYLYFTATGMAKEVKVIGWNDTISGAFAYTLDSETGDMVLAPEYMEQGVLDILNTNQYTCNAYSFLAPNDRTQFKTFVAAGHYKNVLDFKYEESMGAVRLGLRLEDDITVGSCWCPFDDFKLSYLGTTAPDAIKDVNTAKSVKAGATKVYSIDGAQRNGLRRGINIVKMSDGSVRKVLVK